MLWLVFCNFNFLAQVMTPGMKTALNQAHGLRTATSNSVTLPQVS